MNNAKLWKTHHIFLFVNVVYNKDKLSMGLIKSPLTASWGCEHLVFLKWINKMKLFIKAFEREQSFKCNYKCCCMAVLPKSDNMAAFYLNISTIIHHSQNMNIETLNLSN